MSIDILMPALSPTMEEGTLSKWTVKEGDTVIAGQVIAEIETDKATMEVEAVDEGVVEALLVAAGTEGVKVNAVIAKLKGEGDASVPPAAAPANAPEPSNAQASAARSEHESPGATMTPTGVQPTPSAPSQAGGETGGTTAAPQPQMVAAGGGDRVFASPLARRLAQAAGLDLAAIKGSGPHGRVVKSDVDAARGAPRQAAAPAAQPQAAAPVPATPAATAQVKTLEQMGVQPGSYTLIPLDNIRRVSARRLTDAFRDIPHFPLTIDLEIDRLLEARTRINAALAEGKVSVNDLVMKAVAQALMRVPEANASFTPEGIALYKHADIAMAVAISGGLITPVIRRAETKGLAQIAKESKDLAARARDKKLKPEEFQGGTFTVSNLGMFGIKSFSSILNEPGGCILSVGAGIKQPVARGDQLAVATVMSVTLTCDHRVVDGATGARFLQAFKPMVEDPLTMLA